MEADRPPLARRRLLPSLVHRDRAPLAKVVEQLPHRLQPHGAGQRREDGHRDAPRLELLQRRARRRAPEGGHDRAGNALRRLVHLFLVLDVVQPDEVHAGLFLVPDAPLHGVVEGATLRADVVAARADDEVRFQRVPRSNRRLVLAHGLLDGDAPLARSRAGELGRQLVLQVQAGRACSNVTLGRVVHVDCVAVARVRVHQHRHRRHRRDVSHGLRHLLAPDQRDVRHPVDMPGRLRPGQEERLKSQRFRHSHGQRAEPARH